MCRPRLPGAWTSSCLEPTLHPRLGDRRAQHEIQKFVGRQDWCREQQIVVAYVNVRAEARRIVCMTRHVAIKSNPPRLVTYGIDPFEVVGEHVKARRAWLERRREEDPASVTHTEIPSCTREVSAPAHELKRRGFQFTLADPHVSADVCRPNRKQAIIGRDQQALAYRALEVVL